MASTALLLTFNGIFANTFTVRRFAEDGAGHREPIDTVLPGAELRRVPELAREVDSAVLHPRKTIALTKNHYRALKDHRVLIQ